MGLLDGTHHPRVLPITFAIGDGALWTTVDNKPKRPGRPPARIRWLRESPRAAVTVDHYADDWSELRWVQLIGVIAVLDGPPTGQVLEALTRRYPQYRSDPPPGPVLRLAVARTVCWQAV
jgi:PPOX class probable F420-dependent enzyme